MESLSRFYTKNIARLYIDITRLYSECVATIFVTNVELSISISPDQLWFLNLQKSHQNSEDSRFLQETSPGKFPSLGSLGYIKYLLNTYLHYPLIILHSIPVTINTSFRSFLYTHFATLNIYIFSCIHHHHTGSCPTLITFTTWHLRNRHSRRSTHKGHHEIIFTNPQ